MEKVKGLVIRNFMGGYFLCDGKPSRGHENDGELWVGNVVKFCNTFEEAKELLEIVNIAYGKEENKDYGI